MARILEAGKSCFSIISYPYLQGLWQEKFNHLEKTEKIKGCRRKDGEEEYPIIIKGREPGGI